MEVAVPPSHAAFRSVRSLIRRGLLLAHFQPIVNLADGTLHGHEAMVRTPPGAPWRTPDELFEAAQAEDVGIALELECVRVACIAWSTQGAPGRLFINLSAQALTAALSQRCLDDTLRLFEARGLAPSGIVVELTEHERVHDVERLVAAAAQLRRHGVKVALDDFGDGRSSLRLWSELRPDLVKIDKYFTRGLPDCSDKLQTFRALLQLAETFGTQLVAEGIETPQELHLLRDLGVGFGQGFLLGRPQALPVAAPSDAALSVLAGRDVAVFPLPRRHGHGGITAAQLLVQGPAVSTTTTLDEAMVLFAAHPGLQALAVVEDGVPLSLLNRQRLTAELMRPFFREVYGRRAAALHGCTSPLCVDVNAGIAELTAILTSDDQRYLSDGFIVTEHGRYRGMGTGERLVRTVTEARIEAARHANPLTFLPGNIPISDHIGRLLESHRPFVACYADLNHFKPFNDVYGYWRGDEMIRLAARVITAHADPQRDFVGHVGGDDFIVLFQSADWTRRCAAITAEFDRQARDLYDDAACRAGGIQAEDRHGVMRFHPCTTLSIGAVQAGDARYRHAEDVASGAAAAKRQAKQQGRSVWLLEHGPTGAPETPATATELVAVPTGSER